MSQIKGLSFRQSRQMSEEYAMQTVPLGDSKNGHDGPRIPTDPTAGVTYCWKDLNVYAKKGNMFRKRPDVHILKNVSGLCEGGQFLAIMGASGAGKTTLLNVLTYRSNKLRITGDITINGRQVDPMTLMGISAYVQQEDLFTGIFTVREQLHFNAQLRVGKEVGKEEREKRIADVIQELGLTKCADTMIGIPGRIKGISGGEKKRLAFACEMITNPLLLLCDEPTSGLDSFMAQSVMSAMRKMASQGKTIISTIHQPSSEVFAMFDKLLILAEGRVAFLGDVNDAHRFFDRIEKPCPETFNPGDHFIYTLAIQAGQEDDCRAYVHTVCDIFKDTEGKRLARKVEEASKKPTTGDALAQVKLSKTPYRASWMNQFNAVFRRAFVEYIRDPALIIVKVLQTLFFAIIFGLIYLDQGFEDNTELDERVVGNVSGALFVFLTNMTFSNLFPVVTVFSAVLPMFLREHWNGMYRVDVYFISRNLVELPLYLILPTVFLGINYYMVGLAPEAEKFFIALGIVIIISNIAVSFGYMISCMAGDFQTALVASTPLMFPLMLFGGFFMQAGTIPSWLEWMSYLSWFYYGFESLSINQWDGAEACLVINNNTVCQVPVEDMVLGKLGFEKDNFAMDIGGLCGLLVGYRILAFVFLLLRSRR